MDDPFHPTFVSALTGEIRTNEIGPIAFLPKVVLLFNKNNAQKHILFTFLTLWLTLHPTVSFLSCLR